MFAEKLQKPTKFDASRHESPSYELKAKPKGKMVLDNRIHVQRTSLVALRQQWPMSIAVTKQRYSI
jgi:hypothetical protein